MNMALCLGYSNFTDFGILIFKNLLLIIKIMLRDIFTKEEKKKRPELFHERALVP